MVTEGDGSALVKVFGTAKKKRKQGKLPTQRTLEWLRKHDFMACVVERKTRIPGRRIPVSHDAFGFGDILAMDEAGPILVQCTSTANLAARVAKIREECHEAAHLWLLCGSRIWAIGWAKRGGSGARKLWTMRLVELVLDEQWRIVEKPPSAA